MSQSTWDRETSAGKGSLVSPKGLGPKDRQLSKKGTSSEVPSCRNSRSIAGSQSRQADKQKLNMPTKAMLSQVRMATFWIDTPHELPIEASIRSLIN